MTTFSPGPIVEFDGVMTAIVKVPEEYRSETHGICGNNNGYPIDDYTSSTGEDLSTKRDRHYLLVNSWQVDDPEDLK